MLLVIVARRGLDNMALRVATHYWEEGRNSELAGLVRYALRAILFASLAIFGALAAAKLLLPDRTELSWAMILAIGATVPPLAILGFYSSLLRSVGRVIASQTFEQIWRPLILIGLLMAAYLVSRGPNSAVTAMFLTAASVFAATFLAMAAWRRGFKFTVEGAPLADRAEWHSISTSFVIMAVAQEALNQSGVLLLGVLGTNIEAAHFAAAWRYNSLLAFGLMAVGLVSGPLIASAHRRAAHTELANVARISARFSFAFAVLAAIPLLLFGRELLGLYGADFIGAYPALLILLIGSLVNASTGVVGYLLALTGSHGRVATVTIVALAANLVANAILIPRYGATGAAIASVAAQLLWNTALVVQARRLTGVTSWLLAGTRR
jgi:O-antigen/teichoic acid export membrane protein